MRHAMVGPERATRLVRVLFAIQLVSMGAMEMSGPFWPLHLKALSRSSFEFGFAGVAVYVGPMLGIMLTSAFWGRVGDRTGHKLMMVRALIGLSLTQLALAWATDVWTVLTLRCIQGACAGYIAPAQTYGVGIVAPSRRARLFAYLQVSTNLGSLLGAVCGGLILDYATFFWINFSAAWLCVGCAVAVILALPDVRLQKPARDASSKVTKGDEPIQACLWRSSPVPALLGIVGMLLLSRTIAQTPFSLYVSTTFNVGGWAVGLCYGMVALGFVVSASLWARYFERRTLAESLQRMTWIALGCAVLALLAAVTRNVGVFVVIHFLSGVVLGATTPVLMSLISRASSGTRQGYVLGIAQGATQLASMAGIALGGWLTHGPHLRYTYVFVTISYVAAAIVIAMLRFDGRMTVDAKDSSVDRDSGAAAEADAQAEAR